MITLHVTIFLTGCVLFTNIPVSQSGASVKGLNSGPAVYQNVRYLPVPQYYPYDYDPYGTRNDRFSQPIIVPSGGNVVDSGFGGGTGFGFGGLLGCIITLAILSALIRALQNNTGTGTAMGGSGAGAAALAAGAVGMGMGMGMMGTGGGVIGGDRGSGGIFGGGDIFGGRGFFGQGGIGGRGMMVGGGQDIVRGRLG